MSGVFKTIGPGDWKETFAANRPRVNKISRQIKAAVGSEVSERPLFIPLKREFFEAFERGEKWEEFRGFGLRWNYCTCRVGRRVTLSLGYGKARRLTGQIVAFRLDPEPEALPGWIACYGARAGMASRIGIRLDS